MEGKRIVRVRVEIYSENGWSLGSSLFSLVETNGRRRHGAPELGVWVASRRGVAALFMGAG